MTRTLLRLYPYQEKCVQAIRDARASGMRRPAVTLATGAGKTVIFSHIAAEHLKNNPGDRVLILAHTDELVRQAAAEFPQVCTSHTVGIVQANQDNYHADVVVASVMTLLSKRRRDVIKNVGLVIVDEAHRSLARTYVTILEHFGCFEDAACTACDGKGYVLLTGGNPYGDPCTAGCEEGRTRPAAGRHAWALGVTATMVRGDGGALGDVWEDVVYKVSTSQLIRWGFLKNPDGLSIEVPDLDLGKVKTSGGDFQKGSLGNALTASMAPEIVARAYREHAADRSGVVFTPTVASAEMMSDALTAEGFKAEVVHGKLPKERRRDIIKRFQLGEIQILCNCMALTEGFNAPIASCAVIARPTKNEGLYQQMVGRVLRKHLRMDALIMDVTGATQGMSLASLVDLMGDEEKRSRKCPPGVDCEDEESEDGEKEPGFFAETEYHRGPVVAKDFDPLADASDRVWMSTAVEGIPFLSAGKDQYIFLVPSTAEDASVGTWDVCWCTKDLYHGRRGGYTEHRGVELGYAMAWGEIEADERGGVDEVRDPDGSGLFATSSARILNGKGRAWRKNKASVKQVNYARKLGIVVPEGARSGDVAELIDHHLGSRRIDPIARALKGESVPC